ncbi:hypothetical protein IQ276_024650 [Desmonostoc muscorum LEGE 12446]|uniref:DUF4325 domain-containing protein n=1 Tax=Desmonostoc muscorum LEGE 12446 TaxID=1828758 RepID=A0A8J6ZRK1_DESMC|nr:hypothetical protein [Desmonostoc muscorum]MCF2149562.1 hypothetical protein [Desmonostoc muscorum LEGE 12446]
MVDIDSTGVRRLLSVFFNFAIAELLRESNLKIIVSRGNYCDRFSLLFSYLVQHCTMSAGLL